MKKIALILIIIIITFNLTACGKNDLDYYNQALIKTNSIKKGQMSYKVNLKNEFNEEGLSKEKIKKLREFEDIVAINSMKFDWDKNIAIMNNYFNLGGLGFDSVVYINESDQYMKLSFLGKYIDMETEESDEQVNPITNGTINKITEKWYEILSEKDVVSGEKIVLSTEDGEVKARKYIIRVNNEQLRSFLNYVLETIERDNNFMNYIESIYQYDGMGQITGKNLAKSIRKAVNEASDMNFTYESYIDMDGYIVEENIGISFNLDLAESGSLKRQEIQIETKKWNIEREQEINLPDINEKNTMTIEEMKKESSVYFEDN